VETISLAPGGSAANTLYALAKLGINAGFVGVVGDDEMGQRLVSDFFGVGVDTSQIIVKGNADTGAALCISDKQGNRSLYILAGANAILSRDDIDVNYLNQAKSLLLSSFTNDEQLDVQKQLVTEIDPGVKIMFSPGAMYAARGIAMLMPLIKRTHVLFLNRSELVLLTKEDDLRNGAKKCLDCGCQHVVVTLGGKPTAIEGGIIHNPESLACYILSAEGEFTVRSTSKCDMPVVDSTGAGDAFCAGFVYALLKGHALDECGQVGDLVARCCIAKKGAREGCPSRAQLHKLHKVCFEQI